jgi:hypothetical protein
MYLRFATIYEAPLIQNQPMVIAAPPVKLEVAIGPRRIYPLKNSRAVVPLRGEVGEEATIWPPEPIDLLPDRRYTIVMTRTREDPGAAESDCRSAVDRTVAIVGLLTSPTLFALPIYSGWISDTPFPSVVTEMVVSKPQNLNQRELERGISLARKVLSVDPALRDRFDLVARLFNRAIGSPPSEEAFLWAWMCLEVYPMCGTQKYSHIAPYLARATGREAQYLSEWLGIGELHHLRSKLVHSGHIGLSTKELYAKISLLRGIVYTVMRSMCGMQYDGELERVTRGTPS